MNQKKIKKLEFIGLQLEVVEAKNKSLIGLKGKIINETQKTFTIQTTQGEKMLLKNQITFTTKINNKKVRIVGKVLAKRPEERLKK